MGRTDDEAVASTLPVTDEAVASTALSPAVAGAEATALPPRSMLADRYEIERRVGAGGMGVVYKARDVHLLRTVAIKLTRARIDPAPDEDRLLREARAMAKLRHANVATLYDIGTFERRPFVVMEFVDGGTLADWLRSARRPWREVVPLFLQAARGLEAAHAAGFVHRDFKPENVLLGGDGVVRVSDFGVVRLLGEVIRAADPTVASLWGTQTGSVAGTPGYIAPEILRHEPADARADQFSFCVALYQAVYGARPFAAGKPHPSVTDTAGPVSPPPPGVAPAWLGRAILRGLSSQPAARWPSVGALAAEIERRRQRPRRAILLGGGAVAASAAAAVVAVAALRPPAPEPTWTAVAMGAHMEVSRDGSTVAMEANDQIAVEPREGGVRRYVTKPTDVESFKLSRSGSQIFNVTAGSAGRELWAIDVAGGARERRVPSTAAPALKIEREWDVGPDGSLLVVLDQGERRFAELATVDPTGAVRVLADAAPGGRLYHPAWSPDGTRAAFAEYRAEDDASIDVIEVATRKTAVVARRVCRILDWVNDGALACVDARDGAPVLVELRLVPSGPAQPHDLWAAPQYAFIYAVRGTDRGILLGTMTTQTRLAILDLDAPAEPLRLDTGGLIDLPAAGWTAAGAMVFGANLHGRLQMMSRSPEGRIDAIRATSVAEVPLVVLGDTLLFGRFPGGERAIPLGDETYGRKYPDDGELYRLEPGHPPVPLGPTHGFLALRCAGDRAPPCLLLEHSGDDARAVFLDPMTGARGREVRRWSLGEQGFHALTPDGHTLAYVISPARPGGGSIELADLESGGVRRLQHPGLVFRNLTFSPDGRIVATAMSDGGWVVARIRADEPVEIIRRVGSFLFEPRVRPDGRQVALPIDDSAHSSFWLAR